MITAEKSGCTLIKSFSLTRYDMCPPKQNMMVHTDGQQVQAEIHQFVCCLITDWWTRSGLYLSEQHEGEMKGLCSEQAAGARRSNDTHTHTHTYSQRSQCIPCHLLTNTPAQQTSRGLWNLPWTESRHFRPWCRLELLLRFTIAVNLLSPLPASYSLSPLMLMGNLCGESHLCGSVSACYKWCYGV